MSCRDKPGIGAGPHFSVRTAWDREEALLAGAAATYSAAAPLCDLTVANPARCGLSLDREQIVEPLRGEGVLTYAPQAFGRTHARQAVCDDYARHGVQLQPEQVCLTASTSEAYSYLFRLLCDPGDAVLLASPSYPLFEYLAALDDVVLTQYPLIYDHGWSLDLEAARRAITPRTRALALVHPNNPTGHFVTHGERAQLEELCVQHGLALIVDEVFLEYAWNESAAATSFATGPHPALTFVLSGLSKLAALPQMKLSWMTMLGPEAAVQEARARLEIIADTFLSVSAPAQEALPHWLAAAPMVRQAICNRVQHNRALLDRLITGTPVMRLAAEGGWYAVLRVPATEPDESLALRLLQSTGVLVHPGSAFGFAPSGWLVVSLLPYPEDFERGILAIKGAFQT